MNSGISVIIPTYNSSSTIEKALGSITSQKLPPSEIILIDDHSKDDTVKKILNFIKSNPEFSFKLFHNDRNMGPSYSRNKGIQEAAHPWIAFLDSDDYWHPQKLQLQMDIALKYNLHFLGTLSTIEGSPFPDQFQECCYRILRPNNFLWKNYFQTPTVLVKKCDDLMFNESMHFSEDFDLWRRLILKQGSAALLLTPLTTLGKSPYLGSGLSSRLLEMEKGEIQVLKKEENKFLMILSISFSLLKFLRRWTIKQISSFGT